jgi:tetratricopeptide (TPR) repeat protein
MDNFTSDISEKLVQYLDGELVGAEKESLEQLLASDKNLQNELESLKSATGAIKLYGLNRTVSVIHQQMMNEMQSPVKRISKGRKIVRYSMAIAAGLLLLAGGFLAYNFYTLSPDKVFASAYSPYEVVTVRDGNIIGTPVEKAYRKKDYKEVLRIHDAGEDKTPKGEFLCGVAAIEINDNKKAIKCFKEVLDLNTQNKKTELNDEAEYYLSLSLIRNKNYGEALGILNKIKEDTNHLYAEKISTKLIRQVKMLKRR